MRTTTKIVLWLGMHPTHGIVLFDPTMQDDIEPTQVRLWHQKTRSYRIYDREAARQGLVPLCRHLAAKGKIPFIENQSLMEKVAKDYVLQNGEDGDRFTPSPAEYIVKGEGSQKEHRSPWRRTSDEGWFCLR